MFLLSYVVFMKIWISAWRQSNCVAIEIGTQCIFASRLKSCTVCLKKYTWVLIVTSANVDQFSKFVHCQIPEEILCTQVLNIYHLTLCEFLHFLKFVHCQIPEEILCTQVLNIYHLTLCEFLHNLVKFENHNCCQFQWHIALETSEFILQEMRPP